MAQAAVIFDIVDDNSSGCISKRELYKPLRRLFHKQMDGDQISTLVEFIAYMANIQQIPKVADDVAEETTDPTSPKRRQTVDTMDESEGPLDDESSAGINGVTVEGVQNIEMGNVRERADSRSFRQSSFVDTVKARVQKRQTKRHYISRPQWASVFAGPPCNIKSCISLIDRKRAQGHFTPADEDKHFYQELEDCLTMDEHAEETVIASGKMGAIDCMHSADSREILERMQEDIFELKQQVAMLLHRVLTIQGVPSNRRADTHGGDLRPPASQNSKTTHWGVGDSQQSLGQSTSSDWWNGQFFSSQETPKYGWNFERGQRTKAGLQQAPIEKNHDANDTYINPTFTEQKGFDFWSTSLSNFGSQASAY